MDKDIRYVVFNVIVISHGSCMIVLTTPKVCLEGLWFSAVWMILNRFFTTVKT